MKNRLLILFASLLFLCSIKPDKTYASHAAGGEIIYEWISDSTYRIFFKFYRDCTGIKEDSLINLCITNGCSLPGGSPQMHKWTGPMPGNVNNGDPVSLGCDNTPTKCTDPLNSKIAGYREWWYFHLWTAPGKCTDWNFSVSISARNSSNNIQATPAGGFNLYVETTFDNLHFEGNSSPFFSIKPIPYMCINQPFTFNNGVIDPDGDSTYSEMIRPLDGSCGVSANTNWKSTTPGFPYSIPGNPLQTNNTFTLNGVTGQMIFTPTEGGASTITTKVSEYEIKYGNPFRGMKKGHIMRDVQVQVLDCSTKAPKFVIPTASIFGGSWLNNTINGCTGQKLIFDFYSKGNLPDDILNMEDNHTFSIPGATIIYTNRNTDSAHGHFEWTPGPGDDGFKSFIIITNDSTCRPPGILLAYPTIIPIYIWPPVKASNDTLVCPGETAFLDATGGANYVWTVVPGGGPITQLNNTSIQSPAATVTQKTTFIVTSTTTSFCANNKDSVTVDLLPGLKFTPLPDTLTCPNNSVQLDLKSNPPANVKYFVKWNTKTYLDDSTSSKPYSTPKAPITYTVILTSSENKCRGYDTVKVDVLTGFSIDNPDTAICNGSSVTVRATADSKYTILWTSEPAVPGVFDNANIANPIITPINVSNDKYKVIFSYGFPGQCRDTSASFKIDNQPIPNVTISANQTGTCEGDTILLNGFESHTGYPMDLTWTPGNSLNNPKIAVPIFTAKQNTKLTLTAKTSAGCTNSADIELTVFPAAFLTASNDTSICPGESAQLHVTGLGVKSFRWYPDTRINNTYTLDPVVSPSATQEYRVYAVDTNFCSDTQTVKVVVLPKAILEIPDSVKLYPGQSYRLETKGNCSYFSWFPPLGLSETKTSNPLIKPEVNTRYFVTGVTDAGCAVKDSINVMVSTESIITLPNAFAPGNGPLKVLHLGDATLKSFSIYNRWGVKVFESHNINEGWDGTFKGDPQPLGVYVYTVEAMSPNGRAFNKQGNITLIR